MQCPKCQYVRLTTDKPPESECPQCGIIYAKYDPSIEARRQALIAKMGKPSFFSTALGQRVLHGILGLGALAILGALFGGLGILVATLIGLAIWAIAKAAEGSRQEQERLKKEFESKPYQHCLTCGHDFKYRSNAQRGSSTMEVALWVLLLWPIALIYSIWRRLSLGKAQAKCLVCASPQVVPASSPAAQAHKKSLGIEE